jgi:PAS domain S-box-containing protein
MDLLAKQAADYVKSSEADRLLIAKRILERMMEQIGASITHCSGDLRYLFVNAAYADLLGKPVERVVGHSIPELVGDAAFRVIQPYVDRVLAGERVEFEAEIPFADLVPRHVHVIYVPGFDLQGSVCGWIARINDLAAGKRLEQDLCLAVPKADLRAMLVRQLRNLSRRLFSTNIF